MNTKRILSLVCFGFCMSSMGFAQTSVSELRKAALESQATCQNFVRFDDQNLYLGFGAYKMGFEEPRHPIPGQLRMVSLQDPTKVTVIPTPDSVVDVLTFSHKLYILTFSSLIEYDLETNEMIFTHPTHFLTRTLEYKEHAVGMTLSHGKIYIAHGRLGIAIFDLVQGKVVKVVPLLTAQAPLESMATAISSHGHDVFVTMDNFSLVNPGEKQAFRGLVLYNPMEEKVMAEMPGLDPGTDSMVVDSKYLLISYMGYPLWKYDRTQMQVRASLPQPLARISKFQEKGHPTGKGFLDNDYYYTCYSKFPEVSGYATRVPRAIKRSDLAL